VITGLAVAYVPLADQLAAMRDEAAVVGLLLGAVALFIGWFYGLDRDRLAAAAQARGLDPVQARNRAVLQSRWAGFVLFGLGMVVVEALGGTDRLLAGVRGIDLLPTLVVGLALGAGFGITAGLSARKPAFHDRYPEIRGAVVSPRDRAASYLAWAAYLVGYEYLFRGALLFGLAEAWGVAAALSITTGLYVLAHLHKDGAETASCFAVGLIFGAAALGTGSFVVAWIAHVIIAITSETSATLAHPNIRYGASDASDA